MDIENLCDEMRSHRKLSRTTSIHIWIKEKCLLEKGLSYILPMDALLLKGYDGSGFENCNAPFHTLLGKEFICIFVKCPAVNVFG